MIENLFSLKGRLTCVCRAAFNVGGIIGGGLTPFIAATLVTIGGLQYVGFYLGAATLLSFVALLSLRSSSARSS